MMTLLDVPILTGPPRAEAPPAFLIETADRAQVDAYRRLRRSVFVDEQGLFAGHDLDHLDDDPRTIVLVARGTDGEVLGGVRLAPATAIDLGWWTGSRLVVAAGARARAGVGAALVRAACAEAESRGVLRFEATVQEQNERMFARLGWVRVGTTVVAGAPHVSMRWPIDRIERLARHSKGHLGRLLAPLAARAAGSAESARADGLAAGAAAARLGGDRFVGDDGAPVAGTDVVVACDAILPSLVERDPEWAGWCAVLVNVNDLSAMGADVVGLLDALGAPDARHAERVIRGLRDASEAWGAPVLGGHTQLGVPSALSVTAIGRTSHPVAGGGGSAGQRVTVTADLAGGWRSGYRGAQWDSSSTRSADDLRHLAGVVATARPAAAKDVSMSGLVGTVGMLAEASGCGAELEVAAIPRPAGATMGDWLTCFPGFAMVTADLAGESRVSSPIATAGGCGVLTSARGVTLRWPDGVATTAVADAVTGLGRAGRA